MYVYLYVYVCAYLGVQVYVEKGVGTVWLWRIGFLWLNRIFTYLSQFLFSLHLSLRMTTGQRTVEGRTRKGREGGRDGWERKDRAFLVCPRPTPHLVSSRIFLYESPSFQACCCSPILKFLISCFLTLFSNLFPFSSLLPFPSLA